MPLSPLTAEALDGLRAAGWKVELEPEPHPLPRLITDRYAGLPPLFVEFATCVRSCTRGDEGLWLLTAADYAAPPDPDRYGWDAFETMFLDVQAGWGPADVMKTRAFWRRHLPIAIGVSGDLEYLALETATGHIVHGMVVDFDSPTLIAPDFADFLQQIARVGSASPTRSLIYAEELAFHIHPTENIIEDGARPPRRKRHFAEGIRRFFAGL